MRVGWFRRWYRKAHQYGLRAGAQEGALRAAVQVYERSPIVRRVVTSLVRQPEAKQWVFVLGCYNSGTTLLKDLLSAHSDVRTLPKEGVRLTGQLRRPEDKGWVRMWNGCREYIDGEVSGTNDAGTLIRKEWGPWWRGNGSIFVEKSITHLLRAEWLQRNFPNAVFVAITRNGYAVTEGIVRRASPRGDAARELGNAYPVEMAADEWRESNEIIIDLTEKLDRMVTVRYEDLVAAPEETLGGLFRFIGARSPEIECRDSGIRIDSKWYQLRDGNAASLERLGKEERERITPIIESMQRQLGYPVLSSKDEV